MVSDRITANSQKIPVDVVGGSSFARYSKINTSKTFNMFMTSSGPAGIEGQPVTWSVNFPGYQRVLNILPYPSPYPNPPVYPDMVPAGSGRGIFHSIRGNFLVVVVNAIAYKIDINLNVFTIGTLATSTGEVFMAENLNAQICIVDGVNAYIFNYELPLPNLTIQKNGDLGTGVLIPNYVEYHNTYFLFGNGNQVSGEGSAWYVYGTGLTSDLGTMTILGTGVLAAGELVINGFDVQGTYTTVAAFVNYINEGIIFGVTASATGSDVMLTSPTTITISTAGTVSSDGITFANFNTTAGPMTATFGTINQTAIIEIQQLALQTKADFALAVKRIPGRGNNVLVLGQTVCEIWTQIGGIQIYQRNPTININYGCQSVATIAEGGDMLVWLGINEDESPVIMTYNGNKPEVISTDGIDYLMGTIKAPQTSTAILFREDGHLFYVLTFYSPLDNITIMYDFNTQLFTNLTNQAMNYFPARDMVYFNLKTYFISMRNAALYQLSSDFTTYDENIAPTSISSSYNAAINFEIPRIRVTSNIRQETSGRFIANSLVLTLEQGADSSYPTPGVPNYFASQNTFVAPNEDIDTELSQYLAVTYGNGNAGQISSATITYAPRIDLSISKDGGITWSNYVSRTLNPAAYRQNILHWEGMGVANDICFQFRFYGTSRFVVNQAVLDIIP